MERQCTFGRAELVPYSKSLYCCSCLRWLVQLGAWPGVPGCRGGLRPAFVVGRVFF